MRLIRGSYIGWMRLEVRGSDMGGIAARGSDRIQMRLRRGSYIGWMRLRRGSDMGGMRFAAQIGYRCGSDAAHI